MIWSALGVLLSLTVLTGAMLGAEEDRREKEVVAQRHGADGEGEAQRLVFEVDRNIDSADWRLRRALLQAVDEAVGAGIGET